MTKIREKVNTHFRPEIANHSNSVFHLKNSKFHKSVPINNYE